MNSLFDDLAAMTPPAWRWLVHRRLWWSLCWLVALFGLGERLRHGMREFGNRATFKADQLRPTGNRGHLQVDFAGQWLMGRMMVTGHGHELYNRNVHWPILREAFPRSEEPVYLRNGVFPYENFPGQGPDEQIDHDAESIMSWLMGKDDSRWSEVGAAIGLAIASPDTQHAIIALPVVNQTVTPKLVERLNQPSPGGALYPPVHALLYSPFGMIDKPQQSYFVAQLVMVLAIAMAGAGVSFLSQGRIWCPIAIVALTLFPGCRTSIDLAQNATLTTAIAIGGWALMARGYAKTGGIVLGFLAFKPIWAVSFLLATLLQRKWKTSFAMSATGLAQILITIPFVGFHSWIDWYHVGQEASACYSVNQNWIELSRDLGGAVRRPLVDFSKPEADRDNPLATGLAVAALLTTLTTTAIVTTTCGSRSPVGLTAGFVLLGCYLGSFRFMYYDALLASLGFAALFADTSWTKRLNDEAWLSRLRPFMTWAFVVLFLLMLIENVVTTWGIKGKISIDVLGEPDKPPSMTWELGFRWPWDTYLILTVWLGLGLKLVWRAITRLLFPDNVADTLQTN